MFEHYIYISFIHEINYSEKHSPDGSKQENCYVEWFFLSIFNTNCIIFCTMVFFLTPWTPCMDSKLSLIQFHDEFFPTLLQLQLFNGVNYMNTRGIKNCASLFNSENWILKFIDSFKWISGLEWLWSIW